VSDCASGVHIILLESLWVSGLVASLSVPAKPR
jgi:hypothetical protein